MREITWLFLVPAPVQPLSGVLESLLLWFPRICAGVQGVSFQSCLSHICLSERDTTIPHAEQNPKQNITLLPILS